MASLGQDYVQGWASLRWNTSKRRQLRLGPGQGQPRDISLVPWSLISPGFSQSHPSSSRACSSGTRSSPSQLLVPNLKAELCWSSLFRLHLIALPPCLPRFLRAVSALLGWDTALSSAACTQASWLGVKNVSLTILGQSHLLSRALGPSGACVEKWPFSTVSSRAWPQGLSMG